MGKTSESIQWFTAAIENDLGNLEYQQACAKAIKQHRKERKQQEDLARHAREQREREEAEELEHE